MRQSSEGAGGPLTRVSNGDQLRAVSARRSSRASSRPPASPQLVLRLGPAPIRRGSVGQLHSARASCRRDAHAASAALLPWRVPLLPISPVRQQPLLARWKMTGSSGLAPRPGRRSQVPQRSRRHSRDASCHCPLSGSFGLTPRRNGLLLPVVCRQHGRKQPLRFSS